MKNLFFVGLFSCVIVIMQTTAIANDLPTSGEQLRSELETALKAGDIKTVLSFNNWKGVTDEMKSDMSDEMSELIKQGANSVKLLPLPDDYDLTNEMNGVRCFSNVHVQGLLDIESTTNKDDSTQIPYGDSDGKFYVAGMVQEVFDLHPKPAVQLSFFTQVLTSSGPNSGKFAGSYVYVLQSGKEVKKDFNGVGNLSKAFVGLYIKSCSVQASPDNQDKHERIELEIRQDNKIIFDSGKIETNASIVYEEKN
jgi:hypothetical protein